jgi:hypothetical protein
MVVAVGIGILSKLTLFSRSLTLGAKGWIPLRLERGFNAMGSTSFTKKRKFLP